MTGRMRILCTLDAVSDYSFAVLSVILSETDLHPCLHYIAESIETPFFFFIKWVPVDIATAVTAL